MLFCKFLHLDEVVIFYKQLELNMILDRVHLITEKTYRTVLLVQLLCKIFIIDLSKYNHNYC